MTSGGWEHVKQVHSGQMSLTCKVDTSHPTHNLKSHSQLRVCVCVFCLMFISWPKPSGELSDRGTFNHSHRCIFQTRPTSDSKKTHSGLSCLHRTSSDIYITSCGQASCVSYGIFACLFRLQGLASTLQAGRCPFSSSNPASNKRGLTSVTRAYKSPLLQMESATEWGMEVGG